MKNGDCTKGSQLSSENSSQPALVKFGGSGKRADLPPTVSRIEIPVFDTNLMEDVCAESNIELAVRKVVKNKGSAGIDGMKIDELRPYLRDHIQHFKNTLLEGEYQPSPLKRIEIPKPGSNKIRKLSIPTCLDRVVQQMLLQKLQPSWDLTFSDSSFGFRPGRSCSDAIEHSKEHVKSGFEFRVVLDLDSFFDRINHDRLMSKLMHQIHDKRVIRLIRRFLSCEILENGKLSKQEAGVPQGGPLSPFLSNIVLDELDRELEKRGLRFSRYCDDLQIYVKTEKAGSRVLESISRFSENKLKLKVNQSKSAVDKPQKRKFLGFTLSGGKHPNKIKVHADSVRKFKDQIRTLTRRNSGKSLEQVIANLNPYLRGWSGYFSASESVLPMRDLDSWIRRRLRCYQWKAWKTYKTRKKMLIKLGVRYDLAQTTAFTSKSYWRLSRSPGYVLH